MSKIFDDPDDQFWFHNKLWEGVIDSNAPRKKHVIKANQLPFMNEQLRKAINVKGMLKRKSLQFKTQENIQQFKVQNNLVTSLKRKSIRWYLNENCKKNHGDDVKQTKSFWKTVGPPPLIQKR